ncbi:MAG: 2-hydroxyacyl-CoA dehydratase [Candidatus Sabulitectum sp.]|nr:2-hydroxyacyl-CoA dehydratase [Candidatus Sabulitectum sp.]
MDRLDSKQLYDMWTELGMEVKLHDKLLENSEKLHKRNYLWQTNRPIAMKLFDTALHDSHGQRVAEIVDYRNAGGKSIGTFCIYVPDEIAMAADVLNIPLCGGTGFTVDYADKVLPRDICPLVRSTFGMAISGTCPYKTLKDFVLGETTCDAKKKTWDLFGIRSLEVPQKKNPVDKALWLGEVKSFMAQLEDLSGVKVTAENLREAIKKQNRKRSILNSISAFRKLENPPISGLDALLISQVALNMDIDAFILAGEMLLKELEERTDKSISAYSAPGVRVLMAGTPSPMGYAKIHAAAEMSGLRVVMDESCTGLRYSRGNVPEDLQTVEEMVVAIADRYFDIDCACFSPNSERMENVRAVIEEFNVEGVIHNILQYCHGFNVEAGAQDSIFSEINVPSLKIVSDYSQEDMEQIKLRLEAFGGIVENTRGDR